MEVVSHLLSLKTPYLIQLREFCMVYKHVSIGMNLLSCFFPSQELRTNSRVPVYC